MARPALALVLSQPLLSTTTLLLLFLRIVISAHNDPFVPLPDHFTHLQDLPPISLALGGTVVGDGSETILNTEPATLTLKLTGDEFLPAASDVNSSAGAAVLAAFESQQPHEPAGWAAVVSPVLSNRSLTLTRHSDRELELHLVRASALESSDHSLACAF